jgi:hypothetical protein
MKAPTANVLRFPGSLRLTLPSGSRLWNVEGVPVAEIPCADGPNVLAFDSPEPRPFSRFAVAARGRPISRKGWDELVRESRKERPASRPKPSRIDPGFK